MHLKEGCGKIFDLTMQSMAKCERK